MTRLSNRAEVSILFHRPTLAGICSEVSGQHIDSLIYADETNVKHYPIPCSLPLFLVFVFLHVLLFHQWHGGAYLIRLLGHHGVVLLKDPDKYLHHRLLWHSSLV